MPQLREPIQVGETEGRGEDGLPACQLDDIAQLEAGIVAGKIYLGAYGYGYGATGLTFYDDEVTSFFSPHAAGKSCMLVVAVGESTSRPDLRPTR